MGHVLGISSPLWGLAYNNLLSADGLVYNGPNGVNVYRQNWGCSGSPPIEQDGGAGTAGSHFDEVCFGDELMTGYLSTLVPQPLSELTIAVLEDSGYSVNYTQADSYSKCCTRRRRGLRPRSLNNDKVISPEGYQRAVAYGKEKLQQERQPPERARWNEHGVIHISDLFTTVYYMEDGVIFHVEVSAA
jgi:hypothetical protein